MPKRFFMRFNLQNGVGHFPATAEVGAALQNADPQEIQGYLDEFENIQTARAERIGACFDKASSHLSGKKVVFFGDSITSDNLGYRETVCRVADLIGIDGSVSGGTSGTVLQFARDTLTAVKPDLVSIMLGTNDSVGIDSESFGQVSLDEYERNLRAILRWASEIGAQILLLAIPPIHQERFDRHFNAQSKFQSNANIERYNDRLRKLADEFGVELCEHRYLKAEPDLYQLIDRDGIHLSPDGHEQLALCWLTHASK